MSVRVHKTLAVILLSGMMGCASGPFHRKTVPPPALQAQQAPELSQTPLYSPEMSENNARTPSLPMEQTPLVVVKEPEPPPKKPKKPRKPRTLPIGPAKTSDAEVAANAPVAATGVNTSAPAQAAPAGTSTVEKRLPEAQQAKIGSAAPSPIGELTTGDSAQVAETSHHASDLIHTTREGVDGLKRPFTPEQRKTVIEISTFLTRAEQALRNGDVDGAFGLATKAKILLDELTQP